MKQEFSYSQFKKISYKTGKVQVGFFDGETNEIQIKGIETPHPDFSSKFLKLAPALRAILAVGDEVMITPKEIQFKDKDRTIIADIKTENYSGEIKLVVNTANFENAFVSEILDIIDEIKFESKLYLQGKTAQLEIPFNEETTAMRAKVIYNALTKGVVNE